MTETATHIAGDWGTTHLRLHLCRGSTVLERCDGPGIGALRTPPGNTLFDLIRPWIQRHGPLPVWLAGMVGSRNGWREVPYAPCPADARKLGRSVLHFEAEEHRIAIAAGVSCTNPHGAPDVMRGEETQIIGALHAHPTLASGRHVIGLPGTHMKWVLVENGSITTFQTSMSGELYALLCEHSTLARAAAANAAPGAQREAFTLGLERSRQLAGVPFAHMLFEVRSRQLILGMAQQDALAYMSGLIIGQDVLGALPLFDRALAAGASIPLIGAPQLTELYSVALAAHGIGALPLDATALTVAGLHVLAGLETSGIHHAADR